MLSCLHDVVFITAEKAPRVGVGVRAPECVPAVVLHVDLLVALADVGEGILQQFIALGHGGHGRADGRRQRQQVR